MAGRRARTMTSPVAKQSASSTSAESVASVDDLLTQFLVKLPIKSLVRFKSVSKHWLSLISDPKFSRSCNPNPNPARGIFLSKSYQYIPLFPGNPISSAPPIKLDFNFTSDAENKTSVLQSSNGLFLCCTFKKPRSFGYARISSGHDCTLFVYNPTTICYTILPRQYMIRLGSDALLVFDPVKSPYFKVFTIVEGPRHDRLAIFSSETGHWSLCSEVVNESLRRICHDFSKGVYWNGSIHWITSQNSLRFHVDAQVFDLDVMPIPPILHCGRYWMCTYYFGASCDHLHFVEYTRPQLTIYEMDRDYSEWFVKYRVDLSHLIEAYPEMTMISRLKRQESYIMSVLSIVRGKDDDKDSILVLRIPGKAIKCNLVNGSFEVLCDIKHEIINSYDRGRAFNNEKVYSFNEYGIDYIQTLCSGQC